MVTSYGYGGEIKLICGIDTDGKIIKSAVLEHSETQGLGTIVFDKADRYEGKDRNLDGIDAIAGSTISSNAYKNAVSDAFAAYEIIIKGGKLK
jgi:electron transport complex protein RnfG